MSQDDVGVVIQARMGSKRLPGKVMKKINNYPMIYYLLKRVKFSNFKIFIATSTNQENDLIVQYVSNNFPSLYLHADNSFYIY